jgi:hypothetical protein
MSKKIATTLMIAITVIIAGIIIFLFQNRYISTMKQQIYSQTIEYLTLERGHKQAQIKEIKISHSYQAKIMSYNEWLITVTFSNEPFQGEYFTLINGTICQGSVTGRSVFYDFLKQKNLRILPNSFESASINLPATNTNSNVMNLLEQRNEQSKRNGLDSSGFLGQEVYMFTASVESNADQSRFNVILLVSKFDPIGYWVDTGLADPKQNKSDYNVLVNGLY